MFGITFGFNSLQVRHASKKAAGSTRNGRTSNPHFLGFKKFNAATVAPGNIILRQKGSQFHAGTGVGRGRDFTLFALIPGKVRVHYDISDTRKYVSVDDGTLGETMTRTQVKSLLADKIDGPTYLALNGKQRMQHVLQHVEELKSDLKAAKEADNIRRLMTPGLRKFDLVDLTTL